MHLSPTRFGVTLQQGYTEPLSSQPMSISPFLTASQATNSLLTDMGMVRKGFG